MPDNSKVKIDLTANPDDLDKDLKESENRIIAFGRKIKSALDSIANSFKKFVENSIKAVYNMIDGLKNLLYNIIEVGKSFGLLNTNISAQNTIWQNAIILITELNNLLNKSAQIHKDLAINVKLTGKAAGFTAEQLDTYSEYLEKITVNSKDVIKSTQQILLHFKDIRGQQFFEATKAVQDLSTKLHIDLAQAANIVGNALQNPIEAMEELEKLNISFGGIQKNLILKLLEQNKVAEAQNIVLKKLKDSVGGAAEELGDTFAGQLQKAQNRLVTVGVTIGSYVLKKFDQLTKSADTGTSIIESYIKKIESLVPVVINLIDEWTPKILEFISLVKDKLTIAFNIFLENAVIAFSGAQTAYQNFGGVVKIISMEIESKWENLKNNFLIIWTRVLPAALRYMQNVFDEICETKIPNIFNSMMRKIIASIIKGIAHIATNLPYWFMDITEQLVKSGAKMTYSLLQTIINIPNKLGSAAKNMIGKVFGLDMESMQNMAENIGKELAELEKPKKEYATETQDDWVENILATVFPEYKQRRNLEAPDFTGMFEREETEKEKELKKAIEDLKEKLGKDFDTNKKDNGEKLEAIKKKIAELLEEQKEADRKFQEQYGRKPNDPNIEGKSSKEYFRKEADAAELRAEEERKRLLEEQNKQVLKNKDHGYEKKTAMGFEEAYRQVSSGANKELTETEKNTSAIKENTKALTLKERRDTYKTMSPEQRRAAVALREDLINMGKAVEDAKNRKDPFRQAKRDQRIGDKSSIDNARKHNEKMFKLQKEHPERFARIQKSREEVNSRLDAAAKERERRTKETKDEIARIQERNTEKRKLANEDFEHRKQLREIAKNTKQAAKSSEKTAENTKPDKKAKNVI